MKVLKRQIWHLLILILLLLSLVIIANKNNAILYGKLWGIDTSFWFFAAIVSPIAHQLYVLIVWRLELHYKSVSKFFGKNGFKLFKTGFAILMLLRLITITLLAISNAKTLNINPSVSYLIAGLISITVIYLFYSVLNYFGIDRAFGIDHFEADKAKTQAFVKQGIFRYTSNAMYVYGMLILWIPGLLMQSEAALLIALFNHIYIWVHYYFTELPDIKTIYKQTDS
ncbi:MAG: hypothetical protein HQ565_03930 [Bacteroidetes bacterium]|nr:hypothetical protein [Bacteroidota bacterium]